MIYVGWADRNAALKQFLTHMVELLPDRARSMGLPGQNACCRHCNVTECLPLSASISGFPDHATFRRKGVNTGLIEQTWGFPLFEPM